MQVRGGKDPTGKLLVTGGAGGVGSILIQLTRQLTGLTFIATASRPETQEWVRELGAHHVIDHAAPMPAQLRAFGIDEIDYVASQTHTDKHPVEITEMLAPQGRLGLSDNPKFLDVPILKPKSISLHWELMYTRSLYQTRDMIEQHNILKHVADLVDAGVLRTTLADHFGTINPDNLRRAHALIESGKARGKIALSGF